jgi:hypothetical protein
MHGLNICIPAKAFVSFPLKGPIGKFTGIYFPAWGGNLNQDLGANRY